MFIFMLRLYTTKFDGRVTQLRLHLLGYHGNELPRNESSMVRSLQLVEVRPYAEEEEDPRNKTFCLVNEKSSQRMKNELLDIPYCEEDRKGAQDMYSAMTV